LRIVNQLRNQFAAVLRHSVEQQLRNEARSLGNAKANVGAAGLVQRLQELSVLFGRVVAVEFLAQHGNHAQASIRKRPFSMICWPSTQMSKRVPTTSMWVLEYQVAPVCAP